MERNPAGSAKGLTVSARPVRNIHVDRRRTRRLIKPISTDQGDSMASRSRGIIARFESADQPIAHGPDEQPFACAQNGIPGVRDRGMPISASGRQAQSSRVPRTRRFPRDRMLSTQIRSERCRQLLASTEALIMSPSRSFRQHEYCGQVSPKTVRPWPEPAGFLPSISRFET